jgi:glycosyltransferase involved in cell wall biosynthesis
VGTITACLIVKNEASNLSACLQSIQGFVDQIVVVDTGSTDQTLAIAASFTDFVFEHPWNDDFSAARNFALEHATGDWVLHVDADERWMPQGIAQLLEKLATVDADGPQVIFCSYVQQQERVLKRTLHRHHQGLYFEGRVHEYLSAHHPLLHIDCPEIEVLHQPIKDSESQKQCYYAQLILLELQTPVSLTRQMVLHWHLYLSLKAQAKPHFLALKKAWDLMLKKGVAYTQFDYMLSITFLRAILSQASSFRIHLKGAAQAEAVFRDALSISLYYGYLLLASPQKSELERIYSQLHSQDLRQGEAGLEELQVVFYARYHLKNKDFKKAFTYLQSMHTPARSDTYFLFYAFTAFLYLPPASLSAFLSHQGIPFFEQQTFLKGFLNYPLLTETERKYFLKKKKIDKI